jgi:hypothetical protein
MAFRISKNLVKQHSLTWDEETWRRTKVMSGRMGISISAFTRMVLNKEWQLRQQEQAERSPAA